MIKKFMSIILKFLNFKEEDINFIAEFIKRGKIIVYPTETCYGIGCDATNAKSCKKIFEIKRRPKEKMLPIIVANLKMAKKYVYFNKDALKLAKQFWPGPLTLLLRKKGKISNYVAIEKVAVRVSSNEIARLISLKSNLPIVATSANISGYKNNYSIKEVLDQKVYADIYIDYGKLSKVKPSTIYDVEERKLIREGPISLKEIEEVLK